MVFPYEDAPTIGIANGSNVALSEQTGLLTAPIRTPWGQVGIRLAVAVLPGGGDVLILSPKALREQLGIDVVDELKAKALGSGGTPADPGNLRRASTGGGVGIRHVAVTLDAVRETDDRAEEAGEENDSFIKALLARGH